MSLVKQRNFAAACIVAIIGVNVPLGYYLSITDTVRGEITVFSVLCIVSSVIALNPLCFLIVGTFDLIGQALTVLSIVLQVALGTSALVALSTADMNSMTPLDYFPIAVLALQLILIPLSTLLDRPRLVKGDHYTELV